MHPQFQTDVLKPMSLEAIMDQEVTTLSGGELQRVAIVLALGELDSIHTIVQLQPNDSFRETVQCLFA